LSLNPEVISEPRADVTPNEFIPGGRDELPVVAWFLRPRSEVCGLEGEAKILKKSIMRGDPVCEIKLFLRLPNNMTRKN
jgi:hypothetical protein